MDKSTTSEITNQMWTKLSNHEQEQIISRLFSSTLSAAPTYEFDELAKELTLIEWRLLVHYIGLERFRKLLAAHIREETDFPTVPQLRQRAHLTYGTKVL